MIERIDVKINGKNFQLTKGITLEEVSHDFEKDFKYPILLAKVNNRLRELTYPIKEESEIEFLDLTSREGNRCHIDRKSVV